MRRLRHQSFVLFFVGVFLFNLGFPGCGGGGGNSGSGDEENSDSGTTLTLSGTIMVPTNSSDSSLMKELRSPGYATAIEYSPMVVLVTMVYLEAIGALGNGAASSFTPHSAEATTDDNGQFTVDIDDVTPEEGDLIVVQSDAGIGTVYTVESANNVSTVIDLGEADVDTTLAQDNLLDELGIVVDGTTVDTSNYDNSGFDPACFMRLSEEIYGNTDPADSSLAGELSIVQLMAAAALASGNTTLASQILDGTISGGDIEIIASLAEDYYGGNAAVYADSLAEALASNDSFSDFVASSLATSPGICSDLNDDPDVGTALSQVILAADDFLELEALIESEQALQDLMTLLMETYTINEDLILATASSDCPDDTDCAIWNADALWAILNETSDISLVTVDVLGDMMATCPTSVDSAFDYSDWGTAMIAYYEGLDDPSTYDAEATSGYWTYQIEEGADIDSLVESGTISSDSVSNAIETEGETFSTCYLTPDTCTTEIDDSAYHLADTDYETVSTDSMTCGDGTCDSGEENLCFIDCGSGDM